MASPDFDQLFEEYYPKVYGYFFRRVENKTDVEDLTSVTLTSFLQALEKREMESPQAYLWRIAHNQLVNFINFKTKNPIPVSFEEAFTPDRDENVAIEKLRSNHYQNKINSLMDCVRVQVFGEDFVIIQKTIWEDKTSVQIATEMNLKSDTVRQKLSRALKKVREHCRQVWQT